MNDGAPKHIPSVLLIDQDRCIRLMLAEVMRAAGYAVLQAADGTDAFRVIAGMRVDVVIADCSTPEANPSLRVLLGELAERQRADDVPVVLLTSAAHLIKASELAGLGVQLVLAKPFSTRELLAGVAELLAAGGAARREAA